jgi:dCMP deaminase
MNWDEFFMRHVYLAASKSKDPKTKIGAVLIKNNRIIANGFNGFPCGVKDTEERYNNRDLKHKLVVHAEANAVLQCAQQGVSSMTSVLYTQGIPCSECTKSIIQAGVYKIIVHKQWPNLVHDEKWVSSFNTARMMLEEASVVVDWFDGVLGLVGFLDGKEINI